jgi:cell division protein FtsB
VNTKQSTRKSQKARRKTAKKPATKPAHKAVHKTAARKSNVRALHPKSSQRVKLNYGRILLVGLAVYFVIWAIYPITNRLEQARELERLEKQLSGIRQENKELAKRVSYLRSDDYVEQKARSLGLAKPDEEVIVVVPQDSKTPPTGNKIETDQQSMEELEQRSLWQRLVGAFAGGS